MCGHFEKDDVTPFGLLCLNAQPAAKLGAAVTIHRQLRCLCLALSIRNSFTCGIKGRKPFLTKLLMISLSEHRYMLIMQEALNTWR